MCNHKIVTLNYYVITVLCNQTIVTLGYCVFTTYGHLILFYQTVVKLKWIVLHWCPDPLSTQLPDIFEISVDYYHALISYIQDIEMCYDLIHTPWKLILEVCISLKKSSLANIFIQRTLANALELSYSKMLDR